MGKFPVTNALFEIFVQKAGYMTTAEKTGYGTVFYGRTQKKVDKKTGLKKLTRNSSLINKEVKNGSQYYIAKGGSWISGNNIQLFSRFNLEPESHSNILGFRCVAY